MAHGPAWGALDAHLLRVLHVLLTEGSVSRAALRLDLSQPAVSTALKRLRDITGDKLLVRSRNAMIPTERGAALLEPVRVALEQLERIASGPVGFDPAASRRRFSLALPDGLDATLPADLVTELQRQAPDVQVAFHSTAQVSDHARALESGGLDLVLGHWPDPPEHLRALPLFEERMVVLMRHAHPLAGRTLTLADWLGAAQVAVAPGALGAQGGVDGFLARERLHRRIVAQVPHAHMAPAMLLQSDLLFTATSRFAAHFAGLLPLTVVEAPPELPAMACYLLWHERSHRSEECRWFRECVACAARGCTPPAALRRAA